MCIHCYLYAHTYLRAGMCAGVRTYIHTYIHTYCVTDTTLDIHQDLSHLTSSAAAGNKDSWNVSRIALGYYDHFLFIERLSYYIYRIPEYIMRQTGSCMLKTNMQCVWDHEILMRNDADDNQTICHVENLLVNEQYREHRHVGTPMFGKLLGIWIGS